jgi:hypothetical protein
MTDLELAIRKHQNKCYELERHYKRSGEMEKFLKDEVKVLLADIAKLCPHREVEPSKSRPRNYGNCKLCGKFVRLSG